MLTVLLTGNLGYDVYHGYYERSNHCKTVIFGGKSKLDAYQSSNGVGVPDNWTRLDQRSGLTVSKEADGIWAMR